MQDMVHDSSHGMNPESGIRRWISLAIKWSGALLSLLLVVSLVVWSYRIGTRNAQEIPVIQAMTDPARVVPNDPGGDVVAHQGLEVNEILAGSEAGTPDATELAPAPEILAAEDTTTGNLPPIEERPTAEVTQSNPILVEPVIVATAETGNSDSVSERPAPQFTSDRPRLRPPNLVATITATPSTPTPVPTPPVAPVANANSGGDVPAGTRTVQLGAYDSSEDASAQWARLQRNHSDLLSQRANYIQRADSNGRTFFRLRVLGFETAADQNGICEALKARTIDCIPVTVR